MAKRDGPIRNFDLPWLAVLEGIVRNVREGICVIDTEGRIVLYNHACGYMEGLDPREVMGRNILEIYPSLTRETSVLFKVMRECKPVENLTQTFTNFKGKTVTAVNSSYPIVDRNGVRGAIEITQDVQMAWEISNRITELQAALRNLPATVGRFPPEASEAQDPFGIIVTSDEEMFKVIALARQVARTDSPVLVCGETGTGKELFVRAIHAESARRSGPLIVQNCAALPETLLEATLFGTRRGAFTGAEERPGLFELADKGTLYLDELISAPPSLQAKLLRVLEDKTIRRLGATESKSVNVRVIASLNIPPEDAIERGLLRKDFYYRMAVVCIEIPPLRKRKKDIPLLARHFLQHFTTENGRVKEISRPALELLLAHDWPGNVRELKNMLEGAACVAVGRLIMPEHFSLLKRYTYSTKNIPWPEGTCEQDRALESRNPRSFQGIMLQHERELLEHALSISGGNVSAAARYLGLPRQTLWSKMKRYGISRGAANMKTRIDS